MCYVQRVTIRAATRVVKPWTLVLVTWRTWNFRLVNVKLCRMRLLADPAYLHLRDLSS